MTKPASLGGVLAVLVLTLIVGQAATAQPPPDRPEAAPAGKRGPFQRPVPERLGPQPGPDWMVPGLMEVPRLSLTLGLDETKREAIRKLAEEKLLLTRPLSERLPELYREVSDLMLTPAPDGARAKQVVSEIRAIHEKMAGYGIDFWIGVRALLSPEQNAKLTETLRERIRRGWPRRPAPAAGGDARGPATGSRVPEPEPEPEPEPAL